MLQFFKNFELVLNSKHSPEHSPDAEYLVFMHKTYHFADVVCGWFVLAGEGIHRQTGSYMPFCNKSCAPHGGCMSG